jgi:hypothetical protein
VTGRGSFQRCMRDKRLPKRAILPGSEANDWGVAWSVLTYWAETVNDIMTQFYTYPGSSSMATGAIFTKVESLQNHSESCHGAMK